MTPYELTVLVAATLAADGKRSLEGAVAGARELLDEVRRQEPELHDAHVRAGMAAAALRRKSPGQ
jgi:hypothetical protein